MAGDVVYNGVHLYLTESGGVDGIDQWLAGLDIAETLNPVTVVAGHKVPGANDSPVPGSGHSAIPHRCAPTARFIHVR